MVLSPARSRWRRATTDRGGELDRRRKPPLYSSSTTVQVSPVALRLAAQLATRVEDFEQATALLRELHWSEIPSAGGNQLALVGSRICWKISQGSICPGVTPDGRFCPGWGCSETLLEQSSLLRLRVPKP